MSLRRSTRRLLTNPRWVIHAWIFPPMELMPFFDVSSLSPRHIPPCLTQWERQQYLPNRLTGDCNSSKLCNTLLTAGCPTCSAYSWAPCQWSFQLCSSWAAEQDINPATFRWKFFCFLGGEGFIKQSQHMWTPATKACDQGPAKPEDFFFPLSIYLMHAHTSDPSLPPCPPLPAQYTRMHWLLISPDIV